LKGLLAGVSQNNSQGPEIFAKRSQRSSSDKNITHQCLTFKTVGKILSTPILCVNLFYCLNLGLDEREEGSFLIIVSSSFLSRTVSVKINALLTAS
jgi:ABC-type multidrug transport system permease subunit